MKCLVQNIENQATTSEDQLKGMEDSSEFTNETNNKNLKKPTKNEESDHMSSTEMNILLSSFISILLRVVFKKTISKAVTDNIQRSF